MNSVRATDEQQRILSFWWMLELFSPQQVPAVTRRAGRLPDRQVVAWQKGTPLPWETLPPPAAFSGTRMVWRHTVYLGVYKLDTTYDALGQVFGEDPDAYNRRPDGQSACAGLVVGQDGRLVTDSAVLSSALWATGRTRRPGPGDPRWMDGFDTAVSEFLESIDAVEGDRRDAVDADLTAPQDPESMSRLLELAHIAAGVDGLGELASDRVVIESVAVSARRADDSSDNDFLNSFFLDDLATVRRQVARGHLGDGLARYLTPDAMLPVADRVDVVTNPDAVTAGIAIEHLPTGRWPANPSHALALSQQFAVNRALNDLGQHHGLMGVNGPPGTGKTTMLRDILAGNVVERARQLSVLPNPSDAFTEVTHRWSDGQGYPRQVRELIPALTGFEMVVASSNNAAVENITTEIPHENAIDAPWHRQVDYFGDIATQILREGVKHDAAPSADPGAAWGLVAARLGRKRNRSAFHSAFWFDKKQSANGTPADNGIPGMQTRLKQWLDGDTPSTPWGQACEAFRLAEQRVDTLIRERSQAQERLSSLPELARTEHDLVAGAEQEAVNVDRIGHDLSRQQVVRRETDAARARAAERHDRHVAAKPGVLEVIFSFGRAIRDWRSQLTDVSRELKEAEAHDDAAADLMQRIEGALRHSRATLASSRHELDSVRARLASLRTQCARDEEKYGAAYPGPAWRGEQRELHSPWLDDELALARSDLFIAALTLHQDFLANSARDMLSGLRAAGEVLTGQHPRDLEPAKIRAAWQLFFLVVPLISTTFASASRMFAGIGPEAIGWLLIDEAGQASPQHAVGAIWRAQRTVVVGDPLQLEPVVTLPEKVQRSIAGSYGLSTTWIPPRASVQTLADRVTRFGTVLDHGEKEVWISAPLLVHRRCDDPMFTLCNQIAYNNLMVNGVHRDLDAPGKHDLFDSPARPIITRSRWVHEPSTSPGSHLQPSQIDRLEKALAYLGSQGIPPSEVIAISPFRAVADRLRSLVPKYPGLRAGTIHTAQGREAAVVILVLGGDPDKPGVPANWARTPNLVNVAASRAKRRLYVIGDRKFWSKHNYFKQLSEALD